MPFMSWLRAVSSQISECSIHIMQRQHLLKAFFCDYRAVRPPAWSYHPFVSVSFSSPIYLCCACDAVISITAPFSLSYL